MYFIKHKNILRSVALAVALVGATGCKKLLDFKPDSSLTRQEFFKTEADANSAIVGVYDALQLCVDEFWLWGESRGDLMGSSSAGYTQLIDNTTGMTRWGQPYTLIGRANTVIQAVPAIPASDRGFTQEESDAIVGQARFLRALTYFYLVRAFNEVPLVLTPPEDDNVDYYPVKSSANEILDAIEADLAFADLHVPAQYNRDVDTRGMATKGAVNALQTDVFLWRGKYAEAVAASKKVLDNKQLYSLVSDQDWFSMFSSKNSRESILEVQFDYKASETNVLQNLGSINPYLVLDYTNLEDKVRGEWRTYGPGSSSWKFRGFSDKENVVRPTADPNFILYRLADVMLLRAEALVHLNDAASKDEAFDLVNEIRRRALIGEAEVPFSQLDLNVCVGIIMDERKFELAAEGKRWFDLVRVATQFNDPDYLINRIVTTRQPGERSIIRPRILDPRSWYLPIHTDELRVNRNLKQNPYYPE